MHLLEYRGAVLATGGTEPADNTISVTWSPVFLSADTAWACVAPTSDVSIPCIR